MSSTVDTILKYLGAASAASIVYSVYHFIALHTRSGNLSRYQHGKPGSTWALVTGASDGIGHGFVIALLDANFNVLLHGRNEKKLIGLQEDLLKKYPRMQIRHVIADASIQDTPIEGIVSAVKNLPGKLTVLVNNVGGGIVVPTYVSVMNLDRKRIDKINNVNARFPQILTQALLPQLTTNTPALIMNVSSATGVLGMPFISIYSSGKASNLRFTEALRFEMKIMKADVEVLGLLVANTISAGNKVNIAGFTCTAADLATSALAKVGCGQAIVWAWWRHALQSETLMSLLPTFMMENAIVSMMKDREERESKNT